MAGNVAEPKSAFDEALAAINRAVWKEFVLHYLDCLSKAEAARRCGYSPRRAKQTGREIFARPEVRAAIDAGLAWRAADSGVELGVIDRTEVIEFHRETMRDPDARRSDRIKSARELSLLGALYDAPKRKPGTGDGTPKVVVLQPIAVPAPAPRDVTPEPPVIEHRPADRGD